jgi:hypothetical protein
MKIEKKYNELIKNIYKEVDLRVYTSETQNEKTIEIRHNYFEDEKRNDYVPSLFILLDYKTGKSEHITRTSFYDKEIAHIKIEFEKIFRIEMLTKTFIN